MEHGEKRKAQGGLRFPDKREDRLNRGFLSFLSGVVAGLPVFVICC